MYDKEEYARDLRRQMEETRLRKEAERKLLKEDHWKFLPKEPPQNSNTNGTVADTVGRSIPPPLPRCNSPRHGIDLDLDRLKRDLDDRRMENRDLIAKIQDTLRLGHVLNLDS